MAKAITATATGGTNTLNAAQDTNATGIAVLDAPPPKKGRKAVVTVLERRQSACAGSPINGYRSNISHGTE